MISPGFRSVDHVVRVLGSLAAEFGDNNTMILGCAWFELRWESPSRVVLDSLSG